MFTNNQLAQSYGVRRPQEIAAKLAAFRTQFAPTLETAPTAPVLALVPAAPSKAARVAAQQTERAEIRAYLPSLRAAALDAAYLPEGEDFAAEIAALESRLSDLNDFLILEDDAADLRTNELPLAA